MKKSGKLASHVLNSNNADSLNIAGIVVLFEKIYDGEPFLTIFSVIGEDIQYNIVK
jgi:hypothetical protein